MIQGVGVHTRRLQYHVVVQEDEQLVTEALAIRRKARRIPAAGDDPEAILLGRDGRRELDEIDRAVESPVLDVVHECRIRAVDRVPKERDQPDRRNGIGNALGHALGLPLVGHVRRGRLTDERLAIPTGELSPIPVDAVLFDPLAVAEVHQLRVGGEHIGMLGQIRAQPPGRALLRTNDEKRRKRWQPTGRGSALVRRCRQLAPPRSRIGSVGPERSPRPENVISSRP